MHHHAGQQHIFFLFAFFFFLELVHRFFSVKTRVRTRQIVCDDTNVLCVVNSGEGPEKKRESFFVCFSSSELACRRPCTTKCKKMMSVVPYLWLYFALMALSVWVHVKWIVAVPAGVHYVIRRRMRRGSMRYIPLKSGKHLLIPGLHSLVSHPLTNTPTELPTSYDQKYVETELVMTPTQNSKTLIVNCKFTYQVDDPSAFCQQDDFEAEDLEDMMRLRARAAISAAVGGLILPDAADISGRQRVLAQFKATLATGGGTDASAAAAGTSTISNVSLKVHEIMLFSEAVLVVA